MGIAALPRGAVDIELLRRVHLTSAVARGRVREPRTVPTGRAPPEGIIVDGFGAWQITLVVAIIAVPN